MPAGITDVRLRFLETASESEAIITPEDKQANEIAGGSHLHFCWDWDGLVIDSTDDEFSARVFQYAECRVMGMSDYILTLQALPEYEEGYNNPDLTQKVPYSGSAGDAFALGRQDWWQDNASFPEPDE